VPRKTPQIPRYQHHKASGQAYTYYRGRRFYFGKFGTPDAGEGYRRFVAELLAQPSLDPPAAGDGKPGTPLVMVELAAAYLEFAVGYYVKDGQPTGQQHMVRAALKAVRGLYANLPITQFGPLSLRAVQNHLIERGLARTTINHLIATIKHMFRWGVSQELVPPSVHQALSTVPGLRKGRSAARETKKVGPVADTVVDATLPLLPTIVADMVRFQRLTGARPSEVCRLRPDDLDRSGAIWAYRPFRHKTEHHDCERVVLIGPKAQEVLRPYLDRPHDAYCFSPRESEQKRRAEQRSRRRSKVQPSQVNRRKSRPRCQPTDYYTKDSYARVIRRAIENHNRAARKRAESLGRSVESAELLPHWAPNRLRHSAATEIRKRFGLEAARVALGHTRADVTEVYAERDLALAAEVMMTIG